MRKVVILIPLSDGMNIYLWSDYEEKGVGFKVCRAQNQRVPGARAPLNSLRAPSNFCREPKDVLVSIHNTFK